MMCSWRFLPACEHEDDLVDAGLLVAAEVLADLVGRADGAAQAGGVAAGRPWRRGAPRSRGGLDVGGVALLVAPLDELGPHVGRRPDVCSPKT